MVLEGSRTMVEMKGFRKQNMVVGRPWGLTQVETGILRKNPSLRDPKSVATLDGN